MAVATYIALPPRPLRRATRSTYVRRRITVLAFVTALATSVGLAVSDGLADHGGDPASTSAVGRSTPYVVQPGDTLWSIAERFASGGDLGTYVDALVTLNGGSTVIQPGQQLRLP